MIERDGDYFGRTVNLAARLSGQAAPGAVVVSGETVAATDPARFSFEPLGRIELRNVPEPIVRTDAWQETTVPGVYCAGDAARAPHNATWVAADGVTAGVSAHRSLVFPSASAR